MHRVTPYTLLSILLLALPLGAVGQDAEPPEQSPPEEEQSAQQSEFERTTLESSAQQQGQMSQTGAQEQGAQQSGAQQQSQPGAQKQADIARAQFTSEVQEREPVDEVNEFEARQDPLYFFTEVKNADGQTITHRWKHNGEVMAEVPLQVGSDSWRTWSSKELMPGWEGEWTVEVVDANGNVIDQQTVTVEAQPGVQQAGYSPDEEQQQQSQQQSQEDAQQSSDEGQIQRTSGQDQMQQSSGQEPMDQDQSATREEVTSEGDQELQDVSAEEDESQQDDTQDVTDDEDWQ